MKSKLYLGINMEYDYSKIVEFYFGKKINKLNDVLKNVINDGFLMLDVNVPNKVILLEKNAKKYIMVKREERLVIFPDNFRSICFFEDFGEVIEININQDGNIIVSRIFRNEDPKGVIASTSTWHYEDKMYNEVVSRVMYIEQEKLEIIENQQTIEMFLTKYYPLRNDILNDLFWDLNLFRKNNFLDIKVMERIMISDGYSKDTFESFYKKHKEKVISTVKEKGKTSLFG